MAPDFSVPKWLEPPNEAEKARIDEATAAAQQKAGAMMRRSIGMRRMQADAQQAIQSGVDPITAKQNALFNNAHLLFSDNPEQAAQLVESQAAQHAKETAMLQSAHQKEIQNAFESIKLDHAKQLIDLKAQQQEDLNKSRSENLDLKSRLFDQKAAQESPQERERSDLAKLTENKQSLEALVKDNPSQPLFRKYLSETNTKLQGWETQHKGGAGTIMQMNPDGTISSIQVGGGQPTIGTQTQTQGELANIKNSIIQIDQARNNLTEKDVGVAGGVYNTLLNRYVAQVIPGAGDPNVSANRAQLQKAVDSYLQSQQARGRLSAGERADVRKTLVGQGLGEALPTAQKVLDTMSRMQKFEAIARAKTGGQPLQSWMFEGLTQLQIKQLTQEGILSEDEGMLWASKAKRSGIKATPQ